MRPLPVRIRARLLRSPPPSTGDYGRAAAHPENKAATPGASLIKSLRDLLRTQGVHVASAEDRGRPSLTNSGDEDGANPNIALHNSDLGRRAKDKNEYEPSDPRIGVVKWDVDEDDWLTRFVHTPAFDEAAKKYTCAVPLGQSSVSSWTSVWDEQLVAPKRERRKRNGSLEYTCRVRMGEGQQVTGVSVRLQTLLNIDESDREVNGAKSAASPAG